MSFERFRTAKTVQLWTYRKDGTTVGTPVNLVVDGDDSGKAYFHTFDQAYKVRRLARDPRVQIAPSTYLGKPTGEVVEATARLLPTDDPRLRWIRRAVCRQHPFLQGVLVTLFHRIKGYRKRYYELTASPSQVTVE